MTFSLPMKSHFRTAAALLGLLGGLAATNFTVAEEPAAAISNAQKLALILNGKNEISRGRRMREFAYEGEFEAVGRLVTIGNAVYFKTADQSFIPQGKRFPYPELLFELHLSEAYAFGPLIKNDIVRKKRVVYDGPLRIKGNWAYERPYHIFALVWVDEVAKVKASPEADWQPWIDARK